MLIPSAASSHTRLVPQGGGESGTVKMPSMEYAQMRCALNKIKKGFDKEIGSMDIFIGATALHFDPVVATDDIKHFSLMPGVKYENGA